MAPVNTGEEPQHEPTSVAPRSTKRAACSPISSGVPGKIVRPSSSHGIPALGCTTIGRDVARAMRSTSGSMCSGPSPQFMPTAVAPAASSTRAATSGSVPDSSIRPSCPNVTDANTGRSHTSRHARTAHLASEMSVMVSIRMASGDSAASADACSAKTSNTSSNAASPEGRSTFPDGPTFANTCCAPDCRAKRTAARLNGSTSSAKPYSPSFAREPPNVLVVMHSAPART